jgi:hypothetical protein
MLTVREWFSANETDQAGASTVATLLWNVALLGVVLNVTILVRQLTVRRKRQRHDMPFTVFVPEQSFF